MKKLLFKRALLAEGWARDVIIDIDDGGFIAQLGTAEEGKRDGAVDQGDVCVVPGMANLHSHAHQRAMAGLAEQSGSGADSFWTWRSTMYQFLAAIQPHHLHAIAAQLYLEMLKAGYTRVAEFQYLHHQADGSAYEDPAEMSLQTLYAAGEVGLGITNLPVLYQFSGFGGQPATQQQQRFVNQPDAYLRLLASLQNASVGNSNVNSGIAGHSLRAVSKESFSEVLAGVSSAGDLPVHLHIAEQVKEVEDCLAWSGARPVEYLLDNFTVDSNWCLVHATHMNQVETKALAVSGAVAGLCPTTEANLGDGFFNAAHYLQADGRFGIGSDSHISVSPVEELRWLEYGQRLVHHSRNQLADGPGSSTGRNLFACAAAGGAQACGHNAGAIKVGARADLVVLDAAHPRLCERQGDEIIDSWIFSGNDNPVRDVYIGGEQVITGGQHAMQDEVNLRFRATLKELRNQ